MKSLQDKRVTLLVFLAFVMLFSSLLAACSADDTPTSGNETKDVNGSEIEDSIEVDKASFEAELTILHEWPAHMGFFDSLLEDFNKEYPNISVEFLDQGIASLPSLIASGQIPDIVTSGGTMPEWRRDGLIEDLSLFIESDPEVSAETFFSTPLERFTTPDGHIWGLPWQVDPNFAMIYNKNILEQYGITEIPQFEGMHDFGEFLDQFWIIESGEQVMTTFGPHEVFGPLNTLQTWAYMNGATTDTFYDAATRQVTFNDPLIVEAMEFIVQFKRENQNDEILHQLNLSLPEGLNRAMANKSAVDPVVTSYLEPWTTENPELHFTTMPQQSLWLGGWGWAMTSGSENKEAAWEMIKWMTASNEGAASILEHFNYLSAKEENPALAERVATDPIYEVAYEILSTAERNHLISALPVEYEQEFNEKWNEVVFEGTLEPKAFLDHMTNYIQTLVDELPE